MKSNIKRKGNILKTIAVLFFCTQEIKKLARKKIPSEQGSSLHGIVSESILVSLQSLPPFTGSGLSQNLNLVWNPPPHVAVHSS
jgi:hypothetical protein